MRHSSREIVLAFANKYKFNWHDIYRAISSHEDLNEEDYILYDAITAVDELYPSSLRTSMKPPFVICYDGDIELLKDFNPDNFVLLLGDNTFNINPDYIITIHNNELHMFNGKLIIWFSPHKYDALFYAPCLCKQLVLPQACHFDDKEVCVAVHTALEHNVDVFCEPSSSPCIQNTFIKEGANLIDCLSDLALEDK